MSVIRSLVRSRLGICVAVAVSAAAVCLAGCGGSSTSSTTSAASSTSSSGSSGSSGSATKSPIVVTTSFPLTGTVLSNFPEYQVVSHDYQQWINAHGGIDGHPLKVLTCDDKDDPNAAANCAREMVSDHSVACVGCFSTFGANIIPILQAGHVAWFGATAATAPQENSSPISFPFGSSLVILNASAVEASQLCKAPALAAVENPSSAFLEKSMDNAIAAAAAKFPSTAKSSKFKVYVPLPPTAGDYSSQATQLTSGTDCIVVIAGGTQWSSLLPAVKQLGVKERFFGAQGTLQEDVISRFPTTTEGAIISGVYPDISTPGYANYRQALQTYGQPATVDGVALQYNSLSGLGTWAAYSAFTQIIENAHLTTINNQTFLDAANKATVNLPGMLPVFPLTTWTSSPPGLSRVMNRYMANQTVTNGKIVPLPGPTFTDITFSFFPPK
jgi:ABC-type branched-subunit amino acid transport system substrate-binding protein